MGEPGMTPWERREFDEEVRCIEDILHKGNEILGLKDKPIPGKTEKDLLEDYMLYTQPDMANSPGHALECFEITEAQASWIVLRRFESDESIRAYTRQERQKRFIAKLYEHQDDFMFFRQREGALQNLEILGIIRSADNYKP